MVLMAISLVPLLSMAFYRYPLLLLSLFPVSNLVELIFPEYTVIVGSYMLLPMDPVYFFTIVHLGLCALRRPRNMVQVLVENKWLGIFIVMVAVNVVLYTPVYGQSAIGEARKFYFMFLIPLLAPLAIRKPDDVRRFILIVIFVAACLVVLTFAVGGLRGSIVRAMNATAVLFVALNASAILIHRIYKMVVVHPALDRIFLFAFFIVPIGVGHRTVWIAVGLGFLLLLWLYRRRTTLVTKVVICTVVIAFNLALLLAVLPQARSRLAEKFAGLMNPYEDTTGSWRIEGWQQQLEQLQMTGKLLFGEGVGSYYKWQFGGGKLAYSPHNAYVQMTLKFGLFGLLIYGLVAFDIFRRALRVRKMLGAGPMRAYMDLGILGAGAAHGYSMGYGFEPIMLMFLAVMTSVIQLTKKELTFDRNVRLRQLQRYAQIRVGTERVPNSLMPARLT